MLLKKKQNIEAWLSKYKINNYELIEDEHYGYVVNINGYVNLSNQRLKSIDVKFNIVKESFNCAWNELTTLEGCPNIIEGNFKCNNNKIKYLLGGPKLVKGNYICSNNELKSLEDCPDVLNNLFCKNNKLTTLNYCPEINILIDCSNNKLKNLIGLKKCKVVDCSNNNITTLKGCPNALVSLAANNNKLKNLKFCPQSIVNICIANNKLISLNGIPKNLNSEGLLYFDCNQLTIKGISVLMKINGSNLISLRNNSSLEYFQSFLNTLDVKNKLLELNFIIKEKKKLTKVLKNNNQKLSIKKL